MISMLSFLKSKRTKSMYQAVFLEIASSCLLPNIEMFIKSGRLKIEFLRQIWLALILLKNWSNTDDTTIKSVTLRHSLLGMQLSPSPQSYTTYSTILYTKTYTLLLSK